MPGDGTPNSVIICNDQQPAGSAGDQWMQVEIWNAVSGDRYYLYPCCTATNTVGPVSVEFYCTTAPALWTVTINGSETGNFTANVIHPTPGDEVVIAHVCADHTHGMVKAWLEATGTAPVWDDNLDPGAGRYSGLGHDNDETGATFDEYYVGELWTATGIICTECFCVCLGYAPTKTLVLTVYDAIDRVACMDGKTCNLVWEWNAGSPRWRGSFTVTTDGNNQTFEFLLECTSADDDDPDWPGKNFRLYMPPVCCNLNPGGCAGGPYTPTDDSTCDPLNLIFGPFGWTKYDLTCWTCYAPMAPPSGMDSGTYWIAITE